MGWGGDRPTETRGHVFHEKVAAAELRYQSANIVLMVAFIQHYSLLSSRSAHSDHVAWDSE